VLYRLSYLAAASSLAKLFNDLAAATDLAGAAPGRPPSACDGSEASERRRGLAGEPWVPPRWTKSSPDT
jgi:hypothetical protein